MNPTLPPVPSVRPVADLEASERGAFLTRTYLHLLGAIAAFTAIEAWLFSTGIAWTMARAMLGVNWLLVLGGFMLVGWLGRVLAANTGSVGMQYAGLSVFVVGQAILFVPLLALAETNAPGVIRSAATITLLGFGVLTALVWWTGKDFSFLRGLLMWGGIVALLAIVGAVLFGFALGTWFSVAMIGFAGAAILHDTSKVMHHYPVDRHVGAALELFASVALLFWYVLRLFMSRR